MESVNKLYRHHRFDDERRKMVCCVRLASAVPQTHTSVPTFRCHFIFLIKMIYRHLIFQGRFAHFGFLEWFGLVLTLSDSYISILSRLCGNNLGWRQTFLEEKHLQTTLFKHPKFRSLQTLVDEQHKFNC